MSKPFIRLIPAAAAALLLVHGAFAAETEPAPLADQPPAQAAPEREPVNCLKETGTRIKRSQSQPCVAAPGQTFSREDIERTGAIDTAEALRRLSPSIH